MEIKRFGNSDKDRTARSWNIARNNGPLAVDPMSSIDEGIASFKLHDHICFLYESPDEWRKTIVEFIAAGLERGERCFYIHDIHTPEQIKNYLSDAGINVEQAEKSNLLVFLEEAELYTQEGIFEPDRVITKLINETQKAILDGHSGIRVTSEMSWAVHGYTGSEKIIDYESKLNRDFLPQYSCIILCQYARAQFDAAIIKDLITTHPLLIYNGHVYQNRYYVPPDEILLHKDPGRNVQRMLETIVREDSIEQWLGFLNDVFDRSEQPFVAFYPNDKLMTWNQAFGNLLGYSNEELRTRSYAELTPERWRGMDMLMAEKLRQIGSTQHYQKEFMRKDGSLIPVDLSLQQVLDKEDNVLYHWTFVTEISIQKSAAETSVQPASQKADGQHYKAIFGQMLNGAVLLELIYDYAGKPVDFRIIEINAAAEHVLGLKATEAVGMTARQIPKLADMLQLLESLHKVATNAEPIQLDTFYSPVLSKHLEIMLTSPEKGHCAATFIDTTEKVNQIKSLRQNEEKLRSAMDIAGDGMWDWDVPTGHISYSPRWAELLGFDVQSMPDTYEFWESGLHPDERTAVLSALYDHLDGLTAPFIREHRFRTESGDWKWVLNRSRVIERTQEGLPQRVIGTMTDITEKKLAMDRLHDSEEKYRCVTENMPTVVYSALPDELSSDIFLSAKAEELTGYSVKELLDDPALWSKMVHADDQKAVWEKIAEHRTNKTPLDIEYRIITKTGDIKWIRDRANPALNETGEIVRIDGFMEDISERVAAQKELELKENELRAERDRAQRYLDIASVAIVVRDVDGTMKLVNKQGCKMFGYTEPEFIGQKYADMLVVPDKREESWELNRKWMSGEPLPQSVESIISTKNGDRRTIRWYPSIIKDDQGNIIGLLSSGEDITEQKQHEYDLGLRALLLDNATDWIVLTDFGGNILYANEATLISRGYTREEFMQMNILQDIAPEYAAFLDTQMNELKEKDALTFETAYLHKNGGSLPVEAHARTLRLDDEDHILIVYRDISERKAAEAKLQQSEQRYRSLFNEMLDGFAYHQIITDDSGNAVDYVFLEINDAFERMTGLKRQDVVGKRVTEAIPDIRTAGFDWISAYGRVALTGRSEQFEAYSEPIQKWFAVSAYSLEKGYFAVTFEDITTRKLAEDALKQAEEKYRTLFESTGTALIVIERDATVMLANTETEKIFGYSRGEIEGNKRWITYIHPGDLEAALGNNRLRSLTAESAPLNFELRIFDKQGNTKYVFGCVAIVPETTQYIVSLIDITTLRKTEEQFYHAERRYEDIVEQAVEGIIQMTAKGRILMVNAALARMLGYESPREMISRVKNVGERLMVDQQRWQKFVRLLRSQGVLKAFEAELYCKDESKIWVQESARIVYDERSGRIHHFEAFIEDISYRKKAEIEIKEILDKQKKALTNTVQTISKMSEIRDPYTVGHQRRVTQLANAIAYEMQLAQSHIEALNIASILHDIGKAYVPAEILTKPGRLSDAEMELVKNHPRVGHDIVKQIDFQWPIAEIILQHHERLDGSGYPNGLKGDSILLEARILAVADVVEAIASDRPYRPALGIEKALEEIENNRGVLYDSAAVDICLKLCRQKGFVFSMF
ncbi:MAG TPA: hypothetical protein DCX22_01855 [Dehalococcoidia bacterium]|nr:hypothetical protein [Dehalococcoidia bacterium]